MMSKEIRMERLLVTVPEGAEMVRVSRSQFYTLIARREIPVVRIGRSVRVPMAALRDWVERKQRETSVCGDARR